MNIRSDQIESICVSWVYRKDGNNETQGTETQMSRLTNLVHESLLFLHIVLNQDFNTISKDLEGYNCAFRSLFIVFEDIGLLEHTLAAMGLPVHTVILNCTFLFLPFFQFNLNYISV